MPRVTAHLEPGEEVRLDARPHGAALVRPLSRPLVLAVLGAALVVVGLELHWTLGALGAGALALAALLALRAVWRWDRTRLVLTTEKLYVGYGIAQRRAAAVRLARVPALEFEQGIVGRMLGYGTLVAGDFEVPYVPDARRLRRLLG
jgi:uncharacterized membrane protein YdbT with pleckstrin-like domain